jgi:site-specific DNA-methyltransferase (adenine-specific)
MDNNMKILHGNNIELLKSIPDNSIDAVVTDPPYGLGKEPNAELLMQDWIEKGYYEVKGSGFMGKEWDAFVPQPIFWKEVFRVLKHGGHVVSFFGTRTYDWGVMAMRFAGFEVRDCLQWLYGSGFPKSYNIAKGIEGKLVHGSSNTKEYKLMQGEKSTTKLGTFNRMELEQGVKPNDCTGNETTINHILTTEEAKYWNGWGSALKPANEPIVLARKPLEKGLSIADNVLKYGTGGINIDGCRVGFKNESDFLESTKKNQHEDFGTKPMTNNNVYGDYSMLQPKNYEPSGRFPANVILTHHPDCECVGTKKVKTGKNIEEKGSGGIWQKSSGLPCGNQYGDENGEETIEDWNCHEDCPIKILDEQSGSVGGDSRKSKSTYDKGIWGNAKAVESKALYNDKGGASRFFYVAKASQKERNKGLEDFEKQPLAFSNQAKAELARGNTEFADETKMHNKVQFKANNHPTIKPIKLMQYLVRLVTPPNGVVLDPFMGSGTTGIACKLEGFDFVGMEQDEQYHKIAQARIENYVEEEQVKKQEKQDNAPKVKQGEIF